MGVYIKGMEMPTRCGRCDMRISAYDDGIFDHYECCITAAIIDNLGEKMEDCPLVPVPPHGRLIDANALARFLLNKYWDSSWISSSVLDRFVSEIANAPTIIPAEEGET